MAIISDVTDSLFPNFEVSNPTHKHMINKRVKPDKSIKKLQVALDRKWILEYFTLQILECEQDYAVLNNPVFIDSFFQAAVSLFYVGVRSFKSRRCHGEARLLIHQRNIRQRISP